MPTSPYALVIHGGALTLDPAQLSPEEEAQQRDGLRQALQAGWDILHAGGSALDAAEAAVRSLEDNPHFNAARGGNFTAQGEVQMDAGLMDGRTLRGGCVVGTRYVRNPIGLARALLDQGHPVALAGEGALEFALEKNLPLAAPSYFATDKARQQWREALGEAVPAALDKDTVGAVALDQAGNLAAATSTGGLEGQRKGRIGDTPILGAGTYANNAACAVSCTGDGETIMRGVLAYDVYARVHYAGQALADACRAAVAEHPAELPGDKGLIAVDRAGTVAAECNCNVMRRAYRVGDAEPVVAIWRDE